MHARGAIRAISGWSRLHGELLHFLAVQADGECLRRRVWLQRGTSENMEMKDATVMERGDASVVERG